LEGNLSVSFGMVVNKKAEAGDFFLLPAYTEISVLAKTKATVFSFNLPILFSFCDHFSLERLYYESKKKKRKSNKTPFLKINEQIEAYINSFLPSWQKGLRCNFYLELKIKEFFFILRSCTPKEDLIAFFTPLLSDDMEFYRLVLEKYSSIKTAKELASVTNYSVAGFDKKFKKVFGMSARKWMTKQLADNIYHEIKCTTKSFIQISKEFGFSSSAHLCSFCKTTFNSTPKIIRNGESKKKPKKEKVLYDVENDVFTIEN
jgi:AraC-like DNA-binding protein